MINSSTLDEVVQSALQYVNVSQIARDSGSSSTKGDLVAGKKRQYLENKIKATKEKLIQQTLLSRSLESSLAQHENIEKALRSHIREQVAHHGRLITSLSEDRKEFTSKNNQFHVAAGNQKIIFDNHYLHIIEGLTGIPSATSVFLQTTLLSYNDTDFLDALLSIPSSVLDNLDASSFSKITNQVSQKSISMHEAYQIYSAISVKYHSCQYLLPTDCPARSKWDLLSGALRRQLLVLFLAREMVNQQKKMSLMKGSNVFNNKKVASNSVSMMSQSLNELRVHSQTPPLKSSKHPEIYQHKQLLHQLSKSKSKMSTLSSKIVVNLTQISQGMNIDGDNFISAKSFAKRIGATKMVTVFERKAFRYLKLGFHKWRDVSTLNKARGQCSGLLTALGIYRLFKILQARYDGKLGRGMRNLWDAKKWFKDMETLSAVVEIQRCWRGGICRLRNKERHRVRCCVKIQKVSRGRQVRTYVKKLKYNSRLGQAVKVVEHAWQNLTWFRALKKIRKFRFQSAKALDIQKTYRGHVHRLFYNQLLLEKRKNVGAIKLQSLWRRHKAILRVDYKRHMERKVFAAVSIQCRIRQLIAKAVFLWKRKRFRSAIVIQYAWWCHRARKERLRRLRYRMAVRIQKCIRGRFGRKRFAYFKMRRDNFDLMRRNAILHLIPLFLGFISRRKIHRLLTAYRNKRIAAANKIKSKYRAIRLGRRDRKRVLQMRRDLADQIEKSKIEYKTKVAASLIQRNIRGSLARQRVARLKIIHGDELTRRYEKMPPYYRIKSEFYQTLNLFCRPYALKIQCSYRCLRARREVKKKRFERSCRSIQKCWNVYNAIKEAKSILRSRRLHKKLRIEAAIFIQKFGRGMIARYEFRKHGKSETIKWFIREIRSQGLIGKALINFRMRKRQLEIKNKLATKIQALGRRYLTRRWFLLSRKRLIRERNARAKARRERAATKIQAFVRRIASKKIVAKRRIEYEEQKKVQAMMNALDERLEDMHDDWMKDLLAIRAQTGVRGKLAKNLMSKQAAKVEIERLKQVKLHRDKAAATIQCLVRGVKGRKVFKKILPSLRRQLQMRNICIECEIKTAVRKCKECRDRYCELCYISIHKKGFRKNHTWSPIYSVGGNALEANTEAVVAVSQAPQKKVESEWEEYYDSSAKAKYWFNRRTGEASWIPPPK